MSSPDEISVSPQQVVEILCREPLGAALWRAAANEALVEVYRERVEALQRQHGTPAERPVERS